MATLRIDKDTFANEREVVKEERRMRVDNQPYGRLNEIIYDQAFTTHPYKHPTIGSMADLEAASVDDVRDFYQHLLRAGERDAGARRRLRLGAGAAARRRSTSAACRRPTAPVPRDIPQEPPQTKEKRVTLQEPWPLPAVVVAYHITYDGNPDSYPLHIAAKVLSDGQSSRIYQKLVYEKQMAVAAFGSANLIEDPNLFYAVAIVQPGHTTDEVADALIAELDRLKTEPITEHELQRTKNQFARDYILGRESNQQKARQLAHAVVIHNDIKTADGEFDIFQNITAADVQRVARTYFTPENRLVLTLMPSGRRAQRCEHERTDDARARSWLRALCALLAVAVPRRRPRRAQARSWPSERPPRPLPARDVKFPPYEMQTLPNGLQVVVGAASRAAGRQHAPARARRRARPIRKDKLGLAHLAASLLDQGTTTQVGRSEMNDAIDFIGGAMGAGAGTDLTLRQHGRDEGQLRDRACACCPTWRGIRRSRRRKSSASGSRCCRACRSASRIPSTSPTPCSIGSSTASIRTACRDSGTPETHRRASRATISSRFTSGTSCRTTRSSRSSAT